MDEYHYSKDGIENRGNVHKKVKWICEVRSEKYLKHCESKEPDTKYICILHRMASNTGSNAFLPSQKAMASESPRAKKSEEETFYVNCRAAYLTVFKSSLENIKSKEQLCLGNGLEFLFLFHVVCEDYRRFAKQAIFHW